jgi:hypothetical protein
MSLGNPRSIVRQTILLSSSLCNLLLMISRRHWFLGAVCLTTAFGTLIKPSFYMAIALVFCLMVQLSSNFKFNWRIKGGIKGTIVLLSLIVMCLIVPQVETNTALFTSPIDNLKNYRLS